MRYWKKFNNILLLTAAGFALAACARVSEPAPFAVRSAAIERGILAAQLDWRPSAVLLDALDHGIALNFQISLEARAPGWFGWPHRLGEARWRRELRYFPLTRQYQLRDPDAAHGDSTQTRSYDVHASLIAALSDLRLDLPADFPRAAAHDFSLRIDLERDTLPGALRLPALIDARWRLSTGSYTWQAAPNAG